MNDLISRGHQLTEAVARRGRDREITTLEKVPNSVVERIEALERALEDRPVALQPVNDQEAVPRGIGEIMMMVESLRDRLNELEQGDIQLLAQAASEATQAAKNLLRHYATHEMRLNALDARVAELPSETLEEFRQSLLDVRKTG